MRAMESVGPQPIAEAALGQNSISFTMPETGTPLNADVGKPMFARIVLPF
jgi:hypothetical protein